MQALKALVIGMGAMIVLALVLLIYGLVRKSSDPEWTPFGADSDPAATAPAAVFGDVALPVPADCRIAGMTALSGRLYLRLEGPDAACNAVLVVDAASGELLGRVAPGGP